MANKLGTHQNDGTKYVSVLWGRNRVIVTSRAMESSSTKIPRKNLAVRRIEKQTNSYCISNRKD